MLDATVDTKTGTYYVAYLAPALVQHPGLTYAAKMVAVALVMHYNRKSEYCYVTQVTIAAELRMKRATVIKCLGELRDLGLVEWRERSAPRGASKGRAHSYNLTGLFALCALPIRTAAELSVPQTVLRDVPQTVPHASEIRPIEAEQSRDNHRNSIPAREPRSEEQVSPAESSQGLDCYGTALKPKEDGDVPQTVPHAARIAQRRGAESPPSTVATSRSKQFINENRLNPKGFRVLDDRGDLDHDLDMTLYDAGGEVINRKILDELVELRGVRYCNFWCSWLLRKIAQQYEADSPVMQPVALYVRAVREEWPVNPAWPEFDETKHRWGANIREIARLEKKAKVASTGTLPELPWGLDGDKVAENIDDCIPF
jgi:hypothetical protein